MITKCKQWVKSQPVLSLLSLSVRVVRKMGETDHKIAVPSSTHANYYQCHPEPVEARISPAITSGSQYQCYPVPMYIQPVSVFPSASAIQNQCLHSQCHSVPVAVDPVPAQPVTVLAPSQWTEELNPYNKHFIYCSVLVTSSELN